ncbi:hypothetical protein N7462_009442 [Penicillium macrosclerotiorum]|uniref:uncharacterized protein n=1 Tax=Penicillium macrosclerotiorum TaxID=303699 RepID=UPI0025471F10|nr:uncharacterized protein N7462_009442 [Penicillium macrosclerotiorum]KAJ5674003.1 hypothetical protein N7462_009442 [Penicillium macrosclerotiorum]
MESCAGRAMQVCDPSHLPTSLRLKKPGDSRCIVSNSLVSLTDNAWPPKSPREALLSSPGGRRKYQDVQRRRELLSSPLKRSNTTPNFRSKADLVIDEDEGDGEEDEETLQLQLAEIKARLKLKQLQKNLGRSGATSSNNEGGEEGRARPTSGISRSQSHSMIPRSPTSVQRRAHTDDVQVPVSPTRRETAAAEPWSPKRYQLGIDKGWKANDVSLKRPPRPTSQLGGRSSAMPHSGDVFSSRPQTSPGGAGLNRIKSFSERMAEGRAAEKAEQARMDRVNRIQANRSSGFQLDNSEIETYKAAAANENISTALSVSREPQAPSFNREDILRSLGPPRSGGMKRSQTTPNIRNAGGTPNRSSASHGRASSHEDGAQLDAASNEAGVIVNPPDSSKFEAYSSLHLSSRVLPHSFLSRTLADKTILKIPDLLKTVKAPSFELPEEIDGDFVVFGIVASKSDTKQTKASGSSTAKATNPYDDGLNNSNNYMAITLTDLKWTIDMFLFDTAFPRYYRISKGTVIAILNPTIMPPPKNKLDTNRFSLALSSSDDKILEIGKARDIGFCKSVRKDGKTCQSWVDGRKTEFCDFHIDVQVRRTQGQRAGINKGTGMFGPGGQSGQRTGVWGGGGGRGAGARTVGRGQGGAGGRDGLKSEGAQYDWASQSTYYVAPAPKTAGLARASFSPFTSGRSAANLLDTNDDPFLAAGMMGRGMENKEELFRRRVADQQRERDIAQKLVVSGRAGGVGADYLRTRANNQIGPKLGDHDKVPKTPSTPTTQSVTQSMNLSALKAENVRLRGPMKRVNDKPHGSGVKKTRFITSKGIREAGRESLGADAATERRHVLSDDDDDLEIV